MKNKYKKLPIIFVVVVGLLLMIVLNFSFVKKVIKQTYKSINYLLYIEENITNANRKTYLLGEKNRELKDYNWDNRIRINEIFINSSFKTDSLPSWIELYNPNNQPYNIKGHRLTKNFQQDFIFPNLSIPPRGYLIIYLTGKNQNLYYEELHTNYTVKLGDTIIISKVANKLIQNIDTVSIPEKLEGNSFARIPDGKIYKQQAKPTKGMANNLGGIVLMLDDKRVNNHIIFRETLKSYGARINFTINAEYQCQFYKNHNPQNLLTNFEDSLTIEQVHMIKQLIDDGHEFGNHHYKHIRATDYIKEEGNKNYMDKQIYSMDELFESHGLPRIKSFVYSNHDRNEHTDELINSRYYNYRGNYDYNNFFSWRNERLLSGFRLDHHAEDPCFMFDVIFNKMPELINTEQVMIMWGHGVTDNHNPIKWYTSDRTLSFIIKRARELGLKFFTQSELYTTTNPLNAELVNSNENSDKEHNTNQMVLRIKNTSEYPVNISGFYFAKINTESIYSQVPKKVLLHPDSILNVLFSGRDTLICDIREFHTNFTLEDEDRIYFLWPDKQSIITRHLINEEKVRIEIPTRLKLDTTFKAQLFSDKNTLLDNNDYDWYSNDDNIITIDEQGTLKAAGRGNAELAIKSKFTGKLISRIKVYII